MENAAEKANPFDAMLTTMRTAFGAPGDHGYGTKEGKALSELYTFLHAQREVDADAERRGITVGCAMSIAHFLREGEETLAHEWWSACGLSLAEVEAAGVDDYDLEPIREAGLDEADLIASDDPINIAGSGPVPIEPREG